AKPGGYVENDVPAPSEINKMDEQISLAADGTLWTDIAAVANWLYSWDGGGSGDAIRYVWREGSRRWLVAGISGSDPAISDVIPPLSAPTLIAKSVPTSTAMSALTAFAANPSGVLLLAGTT